ncbi:MAG: hypothetical protein IPI30_21625 [Saprospiraceae bacterium]|nr:hypothetical protein [Candidatus Vicinibacter affinis]
MAALFLNYQAPNGCISAKTVNVGDSIGLNLRHSLQPGKHQFCVQSGRRQMEWTGYHRQYRRKLDAARAMANQWNTYRYRLNGCEKASAYSSSNRTPDQTLHFVSVSTPSVCLYEDAGQDLVCMIP